MVTEMKQRQPSEPLNLVVTGEAETWLPTLEQIVGPELLRPHHARDERDLLDVVRRGEADAAVLDDEIQWDVNVLQLLRMIRRINVTLPVAIVTTHTDRRWLEDALRLAAFSVLTKPLQLESLLQQIQRMMLRLDHMLRNHPPGPMP
jgi:DNA-binding NtrC family response regulator